MLSSCNLYCPRLRSVSGIFGTLTERSRGEHLYFYVETRDRMNRKSLHLYKTRIMGKSIQRFLHLLMLIILLPISAYVLMYYWTNSSSEGLRVLPTLIWSSIIVYIVIQLIKRLITKRVEWYEYTYYLGLSAILIPFVILKLIVFNSF